MKYLTTVFVLVALAISFAAQNGLLTDTARKLGVMV